MYERNKFICAVGGCIYLAESCIEDFPVCCLHDAPQTRNILENLQAPHAYWMHERPIVIPCGDLTEDDLIPKSAPEGTIAAWQDPVFEAVPNTPSKGIHPGFDLTAKGNCYG